MSKQSDRILRLVGERADDGASLLNDVRAFVARFVAFPDDSFLTAVVLWIAHAHMVPEFHTTPRLAIISNEPASGKTRLLELIELLVANALLTLNASPAAIFRMLALGSVTILFDEVDAIWNTRGSDDKHEDLRALLNAGYKRGATIPRCVGPRHDVVQFGVFAACALAGLGDLPETIMSRSVILRMKRRAPHDRVDPFRSREHAHLGHALRDRLAAWAGVVGHDVGAAWPALPAGIVDRPAEVWEPLLAVADAAGGDWPQVAREACTVLCKVAADRRVSLGIRLLSDLRILFGDADALHTETIVQSLVDGHRALPGGVKAELDADAPWAELHGKPIGKRTVASILAKYGVRPRKVSVSGIKLQGYRREHLHDAWIRYLPPPSSSSETPELPEPQELWGDAGQPGVPGVPEVPEFVTGDGASTEVF